MATRMDRMQETLEALQRPRCPRGAKGIVLPITLLIMLLLTALGGALLTLSYAEIVQGRITQNRLQTLNLAEAGQVYARRALSLNENLPGEPNPAGEQDQVFTDNKPVAWNSTAVLAGLLTGATGDVTIVSLAPTDPNSAVITSTAKLGAATKIVEVRVRKQESFFPGVRGAITSRAPIETAGSMTVDGRDRTLTGALIPNSGTYGIFTNKTFTQLSPTKVGGTADGVDFAPTFPGNPAVIKQNMPDALPTAPDQVVGYPEGTLKAMAQSASTYVTSCTAFNALLPFTNAIVYVEIPSGTECDPVTNVNLSESSGILIFHNDAGNARMRDIKGNSGCGCFRGLIIADEIFDVDQTITGAIVNLGATAPFAGKSVGHGKGKVLFSREALSLAIKQPPTQKIWPIYSWREVK